MVAVAVVGAAPPVAVSVLDEIAPLPEDYVCLKRRPSAFYGTGVAELTQEMVKRYKAETGASEVPPHTSMGFNNTWIFLTDVLPRAIKKYGGTDPEALRKAALDTDIPIGGTTQGYLGALALDKLRDSPCDHRQVLDNSFGAPMYFQQLVEPAV